MYRSGFQRVEAWIAAAINRGYSIKQINDYLMVGHFDPTNIEHVANVNREIRDNALEEKFGISAIEFIDIKNIQGDIATTHR